MTADIHAVLLENLEGMRKSVLWPAHLKEARGWLDEISIQWDKALDRLKRFVEE